VNKHKLKHTLTFHTQKPPHKSAEYLRNLQGGGLFWRRGCHETQVTETTKYFPQATVKIARWVGKEVVLRHYFN